MTNGIGNQGEPEIQKQPAPAPTKKMPEMPPAPPPDMKKKPNLPPHLAAMVKKTQDTARTLLDPLALKDVVARTTRKQEIKVAELMKERPADMGELPRKVEDFRPSTPCGMKWPNLEGKTKVSVCSQCTRYVYDFTGTTPEEAEELILTMENKKGASLYKRPDGKFLTADCPVGIRNKYARMAAVAFALMVASFAIWMGSMAPPSAPTTADTKHEAKQEPEDTDVIVEINGQKVDPKKLPDIGTPTRYQASIGSNTHASSAQPGAPGALPIHDAPSAVVPTNPTPAPDVRSDNPAAAAGPPLSPTAGASSNSQPAASNSSPGQYAPPQ